MLATRRKVLSIFPLINRIQDGVNPDDPKYALYMLQALSSPMLGFVNAVVYTTNSGGGKLLSVVAIRR